MAERFCRQCKRWHDLDQPWPEACLPPEPARSSLAMPMVIRDQMEPVQSQATGKIYDTKSGIRAEYKALDMVEVGNDPARLRRPPKARADRKTIKDAVQRAEARFNRGERTSDRKKFA